MTCELSLNYEYVFRNMLKTDASHSVLKFEQHHHHILIKIVYFIIKKCHVYPKCIITVDTHQYYSEKGSAFNTFDIKSLQSDYYPLYSEYIEI